MPGLLKIGNTKRSPEERSRELSRATGVPTNFEVVYEIFSPDRIKLEKKIHSVLNKYRVNANREFFKCDLTLAINHLRNNAIEIQLESQHKTTGINEVLESYEAIEILGLLQKKYPRGIRKDIKSVRIYQTLIRCYLEILEEEVYELGLKNQKILRMDLGFIEEGKSPLESLLFKPTVPVSENARIFIEEFDDWSMLMCCGELFTEAAIKKIEKAFHKLQEKKSKL